MVKRDDLDGIIIATPWEWHVPMAVATMKAGKYAGIEVSATVITEGEEYGGEDRVSALAQDANRCFTSRFCIER